VTASSAVTLQLPADIEKEVVAKDGINKLKLFHICGMIDPDSITFGTIAYPTFTPGMEIVLGQPRASRAGALSASEVAAKMILMGHPVSSCHVPVVRSCFILKILLCSPFSTYVITPYIVPFSHLYIST